LEIKTERNVCCAIEPPVIQPSLKKQGPTPLEELDAGDWRVQMSEENEGGERLRRNLERILGMC
jgi:hypothetical protein